MTNLKQDDRLEMANVNNSGQSAPTVAVHLELSKHFSLNAPALLQQSGLHLSLCYCYNRKMSLCFSVLISVAFPLSWV